MDYTSFPQERILEALQYMEDFAETYDSALGTRHKKCCRLDIFQDFFSYLLKM
jgi:hypothetical protein